MWGSLTVKGLVVGQWHGPVDGGMYPGPRSMGDDLLVTHVRADQVRDGVIGIILQLVLDALVHSVGLHHSLHAILQLITAQAHNITVNYSRLLAPPSAHRRITLCKF